MDVLDRASALETQQTEVALANHLAKQATTMEQESAEKCIECGALIPEGRRKAIKGCQYCVLCQSKREA
ncbi:TraR/DksA C4-type zinc finger protein [Vibrio parahaemolyticus]|uniref:TraR/DksA C4-type zinc finger protein n=1 Tax=Vibrio parahaemolyticus TaxID=670 RepID=UPI00235EA575|nr:TraR/DksA C4-type zinc finger protein [Vibrio parahaemolyticus]MBE4105677.1 TraR/DksA family transcriptional regulator [Vibrio parahaemolyticus]